MPLLERRSLDNHPAFGLRPQHRYGRLNPDGLFIFRQHGGGMMACLVEIDTGTESERQLRMKLERYEAWAGSRIGREYLLDAYRKHSARDPQPDFRLLFVLTGAGNQRERMKMIADGGFDYGSLTGRIWLTTPSLVTVGSNRKKTGLPVAGPIWTRAEANGRLIDGARLFPVAESVHKEKPAA